MREEYNATVVGGSCLWPDSLPKGFDNVDLTIALPKHPGFPQHTNGSAPRVVAANEAIANEGDQRSECWPVAVLTL